MKPRTNQEKVALFYALRLLDRKISKIISRLEYPGRFFTSSYLKNLQQRLTLLDQERKLVRLERKAFKTEKANRVIV